MLNYWHKIKTAAHQKETHNINILNMQNSYKKKIRKKS